MPLPGPGPGTGNATLPPMSRDGTSRFGAGLLAVAAAVAVAIASGDPGFLAIASPLIVALIPLVAGLFPGERAIDRAGRWIAAFRPRASRTPALLKLLPLALRPAAHLAVGANGARGPPLAA